MTHETHFPLFPYNNHRHHNTHNLSTHRIELPPHVNSIHKLSLGHLHGTSRDVSMEFPGCLHGTSWDVSTELPGTSPRNFPGRFHGTVHNNILCLGQPWMLKVVLEQLDFSDPNNQSIIQEQPGYSSKVVLGQTRWSKWILTGPSVRTLTVQGSQLCVTHGEST